MFDQKRMLQLGWKATLFVGIMMTATASVYFIKRHGSTYKRPIQRAPHLKQPELCNGPKEITDKLWGPWKKQEANYQKLSSELSECCDGSNNAIVTQANTPVGNKIVYTYEKAKTFQVTPWVFKIFPQEHPFANAMWDTCAVVGNGGILANSSCGEAINSAQFVMRSNLPPLENGYEEHVGTKTDLVTVNPSIITEKYGSLMGHRRPFAESLRNYSGSLVVFPSFGRPVDMDLSLRAVYTIDDFRSHVLPVFFNQVYMQKLTSFWRSRGLKEQRITTGFLLASIALEVCSEVHLYGYWPFRCHPHRLRALTNHYYDDRQATGVHNTKEEFQILLQLHTQGVLKLHMGDCKPGPVAQN